MSLDVNYITQMFPAIPYFFLGFLAVLLSAGLFVSSPFIFVPTVGTLREQDAEPEKRKALFWLVLIFGFALVYAGWWSFSEAASIMDAARPS
jgi:hypothetical protein